MPTPLTPQEQVVLQQDTDYLDMPIPVYGSAVIQWQGSSILIFHSATDGFFTTDITDLGPTVTSQLAHIGPTTPTVWGMITAIPTEVQSTVAADANAALQAAKSLGVDAAAIAQAVADAVGQTIAKVATPVVDSLLPVLAVVVIAVIFMYGPKKG